MPGDNTKIISVTLHVQDVHGCAKFYKNKVGLALRSTTPGIVEMGTNSTTLLILKELKDGLPGHHATGLYHTAFRVPTRSDLGHWLLNVSQTRAVSLQGASDHGVSEALYLADPESNGIEIYHDRPQSTWTKNEKGEINLVTRPLDIRSVLADAPDTPWSHLPEGTDIGHIHLKVQDLRQARQFYVELLGFEIKSIFRDSALFIAGGSYHHHIGLNTWESLHAPRRTPEMLGLAEFCIELESKDDFQAILRRLEKSDYPFVIREQDECILHDPANNTILLTAKNAG